MVSRIVFGVCVGDWAKYERNVLPAAGGHEVIALGGQAGIAAAYNKILRAVGVTLDPGDALVLLHDDLEIVDPDAVEVILDAVRRFHVSGPVGTSGAFGGIAWWNGGVQGRQQTDSMLVGGAPHLGPATALDGSCLILSAAASWALRFDESYDGFHGYDVDLCRQARGYWSLDVFATDQAPVGTVPLGTHHHTTVGFKSQPIADSWALADKTYRAKWREETHV
jgi:hypothetical protein